MKSRRQELLLEIIEEKIIVTQEELQSELNAAGFDVTQSTVSRDIKELKLVKAHDQNGNYRYIASKDSGKQPLSHFSDIIARSVKSVDCAMNDIVIKCFTGMAQSVCVAIDTLYNDRMLGSIAGDDTILIITRTSEDALSLTYEFKKMI